MLDDLRYSFRMLSKSPGFTLLAVIVLGLGIGANTAIFSVVNSVLIQRLPYPNPDRLMMIWEHSPSSGKINSVNPSNFFAWQERSRSFERIAALFSFPVSLTGGGEPEHVDGMTVSDGFFQILGVQPIAGRLFTPEEDTPGHDAVVILGEGLWRRRFGGDARVVGQQVRIDNKPVTVVGVLPASFQFPTMRGDLWQPMALDRVNRTQRGRYLATVARLRDSATPESAQAEMNVIASQLAQERPDFDAQWGITVIVLHEHVVGDVRTPLLVLLGAVGLVLLIACANVANLMLMRATRRTREIAVRAALGAGRTRIVRQLLLESTLVSLIGGAAGLLLGVWVIDGLVAALPDTIAYVSLKTIRIDATVFLFALGISIVTGILFGLAPALKAIHTDVQESLKDGSRGTAGGKSVARSALVVCEVALSMMLLVGAGLLIKSFAHLAGTNPGFDAPHVVSMQLNVYGHYADSKLPEYLGRVLDRVRAIPGVEAAGTSSFLPLGRIIPATGFWRADQPRPASGSEPVTQVLSVMPGYFAAMNIPLIRGRVFTEHDGVGQPLMVIVNQTLARQFYPNEDPVGKSIYLEWGLPKETYEIAGIVGDVRQTAVDTEAVPSAFVSSLRQPGSPVYLVARTRSDPKQLIHAIELEVRAVDREIPISDLRTMDEYVAASIAAPRFNTLLVGGFAGLALLLSMVGIFGVISYSVTERTQEIGIRRALGADTVSVMQMVLSQGMLLTAIGMIIGLAGSLAITRLLRTLLYDVKPTDPLTFAAVSVVLAGVALLASYLPARRAATVDPMTALRHE